MDTFVSENFVTPNHYCREKKFTSISFISERNGLRHCYHLFRCDSDLKRKGTAILIHGYSSHTLAEYLNVVENTYSKNEELDEECRDSRSSVNLGFQANNPLMKSKYITSYEGSYINYFNKRGYDVISLDLEGHGFSEGSKCNSEDLDNCCHNIIQMLKIETIRNCKKEKNFEKYKIYSYTWNSEKNIEDNNNDQDYYSEKYDKENKSNASMKNRFNKGNFNKKKLGKCIHCNDNLCNFKETFGEKMIICGISMGGAIAFRLGELMGETIIKGEGLLYKPLVRCLKSRLVCTVLLSPMLSLDSVKRKPINRFLLPLLPITSYLFPNLQVGGRVHNPGSDHLSTFSRYDPLYYGKRVKALMCKSLLNFTESIKENIHYYPLDIPVLICHCVHDSMTDFEGSEKTINILNRLKEDNCKTKSFENKLTTEFVLWPITCKNMWHVITREVGFQDLLERILEWISKKEICHEKKCKEIKDFGSRIDRRLEKSIRNRQPSRQNNKTNIKS